MTVGIRNAPGVSPGAEPPVSGRAFGPPYFFVMAVRISVGAAVQRRGVGGVGDLLLCATRCSHGPVPPGAPPGQEVGGEGHQPPHGHQE